MKIRLPEEEEVTGRQSSLVETSEVPNITNQNGSQDVI
jgi:hypothetical protein